MRFLILGAGPAGLSFASALLEKGEKDFLVLEAEQEAGGLCRSVNVDGYPLDIGGGHFLDVRRPNVNNFLFKFMPKEEWNHYIRDSRIRINGEEIGHPFEANIWQMNIDNQIEYLKSIACAGCNVGKEEPLNFVDWIFWKLGDKISENYMIPYNQKMFGNELNQLGTYWMEKLPNVSFEDTLRSCLMKKAYGKQSGHAEFYYPKEFGYGELWRRMALKLDGKILYRSRVTEINFCNKSVITDCGESYEADVIVTTIPWTSIKVFHGMPDIICSSINKLKHSSIQIQYYKENLDTKAHWIYYPDSDLPYHRILVRSNFCNGSKGYWTETNMDRIKKDCMNGEFVYINEYAYPLNTIDKPQIMNNLLQWCRKHNVYGLGRWGEHQHYNSDLTVELALLLVEHLTIG